MARNSGGLLPGKSEEPFEERWVAAGKTERQARIDDSQFALDQLVIRGLMYQMDEPSEARDKDLAIVRRRQDARLDELVALGAYGAGGFPKIDLAAMGLA